jgi:hypothetical protein
MISRERREMAIKAGREMVERAASAQERGQIRGFEILCDESDPSIITEVVITK